MDIEEEKSLAVGCLEVLLGTNKEILKWWAKERPEKFQALKDILDDSLQEVLEIEEISNLGSTVRLHSDQMSHFVQYGGEYDVATVIFHLESRERAKDLLNALKNVIEVQW